jgi:hypothetical protein
VLTETFCIEKPLPLMVVSKPIRNISPDALRLTLFVVNTGAFGLFFTFLEKGRGLDPKPHCIDKLLASSDL